jgi:hypothetical protein
MPPPDLGTQLRQWVAIVVAIGGLAWLLSVGRQVGTIETNVRINGENALRIGARLETHIRTSDSANSKLADILRTIESRTARLEGLEEGRK